MAELNDKEIESFLAKVDQVESLIKGMTSGDAALEESSAKDADKFLSTTKKSKSQFCGFDKSHVNRYKDEKVDQDSFGNHGLNFEEQSVSPEEFMKRVEEDAAERQKQKEKDEKIANELKEKGNKAFKKGDFDDAIKYYTDAIAVVKDNTILYTNRAQAYLRQENNELALADCLVALKLDKKCIKAYIHQGKALQNLNRFSEAIESFNKVIEIDKKHKKLVQGYKEELEKRRRIFEKEREITILAASGDENCQMIKDTIDGMRRGGLSYEQICHRVKDVKNLLDKAPYQTLFRTAGGFKTLYENPIISRLIKKDGVDEEDERKCINEILDLLSIVCTNNDENIEELLNPSIFFCLRKCISSSSSTKTRVTTACLVHRISQIENGRTFLLKDGENGDILDELLSLLTLGGETAVVAVGAINNLALFDRLSEELTSKLGTKFVTFVVTMNEILSACKEETPLTKSMLKLMPTSLSTITNLLRNTKIRSWLGDNQDLWKSSAYLLEHYEASIEDSRKYDTCFSLLGLLMNLSAGDKRPNLEICKKLNDVCCHFIVGKLPEIIQRASGLLNHVMTSCLDLTQYNINTSKYKCFVSLLKSNNEPAKKYIIKCIALCSADSVDVAKYVIETKALENLLELLQSDEEMAVGNTALVIGNCAKYDLLTDKLASTDVVKELLRIATHDEYKNKVKHNAAIAIGKLAKTNQRHLDRLRELHGLEILHEVMKVNNAM